MGDVNIQEQEREQYFREKILAAQQAKEKAQSGLNNKVMSPVNQASKKALRWAWFSLIPSWGLSLLWINIHVFLKMIFGEKMFCKLGDEWAPKIVGTGEHSAKNVAGTAFGIVEIMGLLMLDLVLLFFVLTVVSFVVMIMGWIKPLEAITQLGWNAISVLKILFSNLL